LLNTVGQLVPGIHSYEGAALQKRRLNLIEAHGEKIGKTHLTYGQGASAELVAMATIFAADHYGLPVSTTQVLSSGVAGTMVANGSGAIYLASGLWLNTSAINSLTFIIQGGGNFAQYSSFALYGVK
jgi:phosphate/sulfate permease